MPLFAVKQTSNALGLSHRSLEETLGAFHVSFGTTEDLAAFPRRLARDEALQAALAALIRARQQSSPRGGNAAANRLSLHQALDSLLHVVGGAAAPDLTANPTLHETVDVLISFLISLEGWSSAELRAAVGPAAADGGEAVDGAEESRSELGGTEQIGSELEEPGQGGTGQGGSGQGGSGQGGLGYEASAEVRSDASRDLEERRSPEQIAQEQADDEELAHLLRDSSARSADGSTGWGPDGPGGGAPLGDLAQLLTRLELTNLELRLQLESIDSRLNRMEPRIESIPRVQPEVGGNRAVEMPAPVPRHPADKPRYTTAAAFSVIPLGTEPSPFETGEKADLAPAGAEPLPPTIAPFAPAESGGAQTGATATPRAVVLRYAAAEDLQGSDAAETPEAEKALETQEAPEMQRTPEDVRDGLATEGNGPAAEDGLFSGVAGAGATASDPPALAGERGNAGEVRPAHTVDLAAARIADSVNAPNEDAPSEPSAARSVSPPAALPTSTLSPPASAKPQVPVREPRFVAAAKPSRRSRITSLRLSDPAPEATGELPRLDAERSRVSDVDRDADSDASNPASDRRRRWQATLIVLFLLLLAGAALAAFLFLGNPETTTFRGAVDPPRSGLVM